MTLIQDNSIRIIKELVNKSELFSANENSGVGHTDVKGALREIFISDVLNFFLPTHFGIGYGIIINHKGDQSNQTDVVVYDKRVLPPFIYGGRIGVYPAESVIATIEVKSYLRNKELKVAENSAKKLHEEIYGKQGFHKDYQMIYEDINIKPICGVIGLRQDEKALFKKLLADNNDSRLYLKDIKYLSAICHIKKYSWISFDRAEYCQVSPERWKHDTGNPPQETVRFIALMIDRIRTLSEIRLREFSNGHRDWISIYTRKQ